MGAEREEVAKMLSILPAQVLVQAASICEALLRCAEYRRTFLADQEEGGQNSLESPDI